jgi:hypothetical protein
MSNGQSTQKTRSARPLFLLILILAACLLIPALRDVAWLFGVLIVLTTVGALVYLARAPRR